jgi:hypothetical protein
MKVNTSPEILSIIDSPIFYERVRQYSLIINESISNITIRDITVNESIPRIVFRLAFAKDKQGYPVFKGISSNTENLEFIIYSLLTSSIFIDNFIRLASCYTASKLIRSIPLNGDLKLLDVANRIEQEANEEINLVIGVLSEDSAKYINESLLQLSNREGKLSLSSTPAFYISQEINYLTIPSNAFDLVKEDIARINNVKTYPSISIPPGYNGYCLFTLTSNKESKLYEELVELEDKEDIDSIVYKLGTLFNQAYKNLNSNLLCTTNIDNIKSVELKYLKQELYPNSITNNEKQLVFVLSTKVHFLNFTARELSSFINREFISILFFLCPITIQDPLSNRSKWLRGVPGIIAGINPDYKSLSNKGPHSLFIDVEKGSVIPSATDTEDEVNTFYFSNTQPISGTITIRASSAPFSNNISSWNLTFNGANSEQIAYEILNSIYERRDNNELIGSLPYSNAISIVPFVLTNEEVRIVIDIFNPIEELLIGTGSSKKILTSYKKGNRSITVKSQLDYVNYARNTKEEDKPYSVGLSIKANESNLMVKANQRIKYIERRC